MSQTTPDPQTYEPPARAAASAGRPWWPRGPRARAAASAGDAGREVHARAPRRPVGAVRPAALAGSGHAQRLLAPGERQERGGGEVDRRLGRGVGLDVVAVDRAPGGPRGAVVAVEAGEDVAAA